MALTTDNVPQVKGAAQSKALLFVSAALLLMSAATQLRIDHAQVCLHAVGAVPAMKQLVP